MARRSVVANPVPEKFTVTAPNAFAVVEAVIEIFATAVAAELALIEAPGKSLVLESTMADAARAAPGAKRTEIGAPNDHNIVDTPRVMETIFRNNDFLI
jgi:hypothetical protein